MRTESKRDFARRAIAMRSLRDATEVLWNRSLTKLQVWVTSDGRSVFETGDRSILNAGKKIPIDLLSPRSIKCPD
jgi:hypothetical protein